MKEEKIILLIRFNDLGGIDSISAYKNLSLVIANEELLWNGSKLSEPMTYRRYRESDRNLFEGTWRLYETQLIRSQWQ